MKLKTILVIALSLFVVEASFAQAKNKNKHKKITVSGYVTDVNEKPLARVAIVVDGVGSNVFTNKKGFYKIKIKPETETLMAYEMNHGGVEIEYVGHTKINFVLLADPTNAKYISPEEGKMYDYGYGKEIKKNSSSSMFLIEGNNLDNNSYKDIYDMIRGKVPGVSVIGSTVKIRGIGSVNSGTSPMFIVDGVEAISIDNISPILVQSITVLKGPETAIYGSRGANGVIVITLKK